MTNRHDLEMDVRRGPRAAAEERAGTMAKDAAGLVLAPADRTLQKIILALAKDNSAGTLRVSEAEISYAALADEAARCAGALRSAGIDRGDRVAILSENRWEVVQCLLGC